MRDIIVNDFYSEGEGVGEAAGERSSTSRGDAMNTSIRMQLLNYYKPDAHIRRYAKELSLLD